MYTETGRWPADELWGVIPDGLSEYLPKDFTFSLRPEQDIRYSIDNYIGNVKYQTRYGQFEVAISVHSKDIFILNSIKTLLIGNAISTPGFSGYSRVSYIVKDLEQSDATIKEDEDGNDQEEDLKDEEDDKDDKEDKDKDKDEDDDDDDDKDKDKDDKNDKKDKDNEKGKKD